MCTNTSTNTHIKWAHARNPCMFRVTSSKKPAISGASSFLHVSRPPFALSLSICCNVSLYSACPSLHPSPHPFTAWCPSFLLSLPLVHLFPSQAAEAEEGWDEDPERHQYREHQAAVISGVRVRGARPGPNRILGRGGGALFFTFSPLAVILFLLLFLSLFQARMWLQFWHIYKTHQRLLLGESAKKTKQKKTDWTWSRMQPNQSQGSLLPSSLPFITYSAHILGLS